MSGQFLGQVARYLSIWHQDGTLTTGLDLAKRLLPSLEYLMLIYPSEREFSVLSRAADLKTHVC